MRREPVFFFSNPHINNTHESIATSAVTYTYHVPPAMSAPATTTAGISTNGSRILSTFLAFSLFIAIIRASR